MTTSVVRAARILDLLAHAEKPLSLTHIAAALGIPKSTAYGILRDLVGESFVEVGEPALYSIGLKAFEVGAAHLRRVGAVGVVVPELVRLTRTLNMTSHYAVLDRTDSVYLCKEDPPGQAVQLASSIGARLPSHTTAVGKACLAWLEPERIAEHIDPDQCETPLAELYSELEQVRSRGFADDEGQTAVGIRCVAAPVFDTSRCRGSIGVSHVLDTSHSFEQVTQEVRAAATRATMLLGGREPR